jgi:hypothetical protein
MTPSWKGESLQVVDLLVDLIGIEPMTSSMPWNRAKPQTIDGTALMSRYSRHNRHNRRYLRQRCDKLLAAGHRADRVGSALFRFWAPISSRANEATLPSNRELEDEKKDR